MWLFFVLLAFLLACLGSGLLLFPAARVRLGLLLGGIWHASSRWRQHGGLSCLQWGRHAGSKLGGSIRNVSHLLRRRWPVLLAALVLLGAPVLLALALSGKIGFDGFQGRVRDSNEQVLALLQGEQLTAPLALPPLIFATAEVVQQRPMLAAANRNWQLLDPGFSQRLLRVFRIMREQYGYDMAILEGYRSPERQNLLAQAGSAVTHARAFQSYHQFGMAADCAFLRDGKLQISEQDPWTMRGYHLYGEVAEAAGLRWGGRWTMLDLGHVEWPQAGVLGK